MLVKKLNREIGELERFDPSGFTELGWPVGVYFLDYGPDYPLDHDTPCRYYIVIVETLTGRNGTTSKQSLRYPAWNEREERAFYTKLYGLPVVVVSEPEDTMDIKSLARIREDLHNTGKSKLREIAGW